MQPEIKTTADGSHTLSLPWMDEQYHSKNGAVTESAHVYIKNGYNFCQNSEKTVFEVGFGTGLNCLLTAIEAEKLKTPTSYISVEKYPLHADITSRLNYPETVEGAATLYNKIITAGWGQFVGISPYFRVWKIQADLVASPIPVIPGCHVVYFDAFGPDKQPEMWEVPVLEKICAILNDNGIFVTYSAKGEVRRRLTNLGLIMERIPGPPGKKEMLRGIKKPQF